MSATKHKSCQILTPAKQNWTIQFTVHCMSLSGPHQMAPVHNVVSSAA